VSEEPQRTIRFRFSKLGKIRFTSQRDVARMWERALRRSGLPVAWSKGFSPRPLLSFGLALPTGCESLAEYLDARLAEPETGTPGGLGAETPWSFLKPEIGPELAQVMTNLLPDGLVVQACADLAGGSESLQQEVTSCSWEMEVLEVIAGGLADRIERLLDAPTVPVQRERKGRLVQDDLRPSVISLVSVPDAATTAADGIHHKIRAELATRPRGVRPKELLEGLGADLVLARACRTHQWIERDGARWEPLPLGGEASGAGAPHAQERAS
jgi:hypothetical protein